MTTATIGAKVSNGIIDLTNNGDLVTLDTTGSFAAGFTLTNNDNIVTAAIQTTMIAGTAAAAVIDGAIIVTDNDDLTTLEFWGSSLKTLTITGNSDLTKITGDKVIAIGATAGPSVSISGNDLEASVAQVLTATTGAFTTNSNIGSLAAYLKLVQADVKSNAAVYFDTVQSTTSSVSVETGSTTTGAVAANVVLLTTPGSGGVTTGNNAAIKGQRAWAIPNTAGIGVRLTVDTVNILHNGTGYGLVTTTGNMAIDLVALKSALATSRATTLGTTLNFRAESNPDMPNVVFKSALTSATGGNGENYTNTEVAAIGAGTNNAFVTSWDNFTITIGGLSATASINTVSSAHTTAINLVAVQLGNAWEAKYGTGLGSANLSLWDNVTSTAATIGISLKASTSGSRGFGESVSIAWTKATAAQISAATAGVVTKTSALVMDWIIGATEATTDNSATGQAIVMTLAEVTNSVSKTTMQATASFTPGAGAAIELATTNITVGAGTDTTTAATIFPTDARGDVILTEGANEGTTTATVARVSTDRSQWTFTAG
jgi:hypothetical protein